MVDCMPVVCWKYSSVIKVVMIMMILMGDESECRWHATVTMSDEVDTMKELIATMMKLAMTTGSA